MVCLDQMSFVVAASPWSTKTPSVSEVLEVPEELLQHAVGLGSGEVSAVQQVG